MANTSTTSPVPFAGDPSTHSPLEVVRTTEGERVRDDQERRVLSLFRACKTPRQKEHFLEVIEHLGGMGANTPALSMAHEQTA